MLMERRTKHVHLFRKRKVNAAVLMLTLMQISAEVFPTKYRCTCAGISAAAGKLGSIIAQFFLMYAKFGPSHQGVFTQASPWLGAVLLV